MERLRSIVEDNTTPAGRIFELSTQVLIVLALVGYSIETIPGLSPQINQLLTVSEAIIVGLFTVEYLLRLIVAKRKVGYVFSFFGIIDILAILPFYLSFGIDLRSLRILRLLRLFRAFKLVRYSRAIQRFHLALRLAKEELILYSIVSFMLLYLAAAGIHYFENEAQPEAFSSIFTSLWWAVTTLTTVGYGDVYPVTFGGRVFTFLVLMIGLGMVAVPTGLVSTALTEARRMEKIEDLPSNQNLRI